MKKLFGTISRGPGTAGHGATAELLMRTLACQGTGREWATDGTPIKSPLAADPDGAAGYGWAGGATRFRSGHADVGMVE